MERLGRLTAERLEQPRRRALRGQRVRVVDDEHQIVLEAPRDRLREETRERVRVRALVRLQGSRRDTRRGQLRREPGYPWGQRSGQVAEEGGQRCSLRGGGDPGVVQIRGPGSDQGRLSVTGPRDDESQSLAEGLVEALFETRSAQDRSKGRTWAMTRLGIGRGRDGTPPFP